MSRANKIPEVTTTTQATSDPRERNQWPVVFSSELSLALFIAVLFQLISDENSPSHGFPLRQLGRS